MPVWPSTLGYKEQHCGGYTAGQSSCTGQWLTSLAIASNPTKATVKPHPHEWINKPPSCIFQTDASAKVASQRAHLSQQSNYKCYFIHGWCTYSLGYISIKCVHATSANLNFNPSSAQKTGFWCYPISGMGRLPWSHVDLEKCKWTTFNWDSFNT